MFRVVEGGCRFGEIDAVLRNVRFFFLGIPCKSQPLDTGTVWDNINIELQYNSVGNCLPACAPCAGHSPVSPFAQFTRRGGRTLSE